MNHTDSKELSEFLNSPPFEKCEQKYSQWISETRLEVETVLKKDEKIPRLLLACLRHLEVYAGCLEMNTLLDIEAVENKIREEFDRESSYSMTANTSEEETLVKGLENVLNAIRKLDKGSLEKNPDVQNIIKTIKKVYNDQTKDFRCIIYVKTRSTAKALSETLHSIEFLNCQHLTGSQVGIEYGGVSLEKQKEILKNFENGVHKCLVATSVASEGIDIRLLSLVIRYRFTGNEISSLQIKGRVRSFGGIEVNIASSKEDRREILNVDRIDLMRKAVNAVLQDDKIEEDIKRREIELYKLEESQRCTASNNDKVKVTENFEVICRQCSQTIVAGHNLRILKKQHHLVYDRLVKPNITPRPIKPIITEEFRLTDLVFGKCGHEWGHIFVYKDCEFVCLAQKKVKIFNVDKKKIIPITKWSDIPYTIQPLTEDEVVEFRL